MTSELKPDFFQNTHLVVVHSTPPGQYTAQAMFNPQIRAVAATEQEAIEQVQQQLTEWLATAHLVMVQVPTPRATNYPPEPPRFIDPNDPAEQEYLEILAQMRREDLERTLREYDQ